MTIPRVYLDECVNHATVPYLQQRDWLVTTARAENMESASDDDQAHYAATNELLLVTTNERDFIAIHALWQRGGRQHFGIVTIPQRNSARFFVRSTLMLDWIAAEYPDTRNRLFRWTDLQQRMIGGYTLSGYTEEEIALALGRISELP